MRKLGLCLTMLYATSCSAIPPCAGVSQIEFEKADIAVISRVLAESIVSHNQWYRENCS